MDVASAMQVDVSGSMAAQAIKDSTGAQVVTKTLDKMAAMAGGAAQPMSQEYQFQKEVLGAAGIGNQLDVEV